MMRISEFFKGYFRAFRRIIMSLTASAIAMAGAFSQRALSQEVQPMYGVPYPPVVKYGAPPLTVTPMPGPTDVIQGILPGKSYIVAISAVAVIVVFAALGLLYYFSRKKK
jgi:hypothetical protein